MSTRPRYPAIDRQSTEVLGIDTAYMEMGDPANQPLLLVHGMTTSADSYRETMYGLSDAFYMIAPDLPGFGFSDKIRPFTFEHLSIWLIVFCIQRGIKQFDLVGHSFGGVIALCLAAKYPMMVKRMLLAAPPVFNSQSYPGYLRRFGLTIGAYDIAALLSKTWPLVLFRVKAPFFNPELVDESLFARRIEDYRRARSSADALKALAFTDLNPYVEETTRPVCLLWGENDETVPQQDAERLAACLDDVQIETIAKSGHVTLAEHPQQFVAIVRRFFDSGG